MRAAPKFKTLSPSGFSDGKMEDNAAVNIDAILQTILGSGDERFGMAAAVLRGERIIAQGASGVRKRGTAARLTFEDQFHMGSCTKAMTATLVAMLVEEGKLNWTTTLGELFADTVRPMHPAWEKVTLRQVLAHRAGLRLDPDGLARVFRLISTPWTQLHGRPEAMRFSEETLPQQRLEIAKKALSHPPMITPDTKYWYSNEGYILAGVVLEHFTGRAWEDLMRERLFEPLGISTGGFGAPGTAGKIDQPWGHSPIFGRPLDPGNPAVQFPLYYGPVGLAHMTIGDWAKFIGLHLRGDPANPRRQLALLKPDTFAELHALAPGATYSRGWVMRGITSLATGVVAPAVTYRAGWFITTASWAKGNQPGDTGRLLWHGGSIGSWLSAVVVAPETDFAVLVACNRGLDIAIWKTRQAAKALIRTFAPNQIS